jgi:hypothetical protein
LIAKGIQGVFWNHHLLDGVVVVIFTHKSFSLIYILSIKSQEDSTMSNERASNDTPNFLTFDAPVVTFISCDDVTTASSLEENDGATSVDIQFNYELFTSEDVDIASAVMELEGALLGGVADELGLFSCSRRNKVKGLVRGMMGEPDVLGISSLPADEVADGEIYIYRYLFDQLHLNMN